MFNAAAHNVSHVKKDTLFNKITVKNVWRIVNHATLLVDALNVKIVMFLTTVQNFV